MSRQLVKFKKILIWILLIESMLILSTRLGAFLHEVVGHGALAMLLGGDFKSFRLTLFAGGEAEFSGQLGQAATIAIQLGGILVNLLSGLIALWLAQRRGLSFSVRLFSLLVAGVSILSQLQYLALGAYYRFGDPACLAGCHPLILFLAWTGGLIALAGFSFLIMSLFFRFQEASFPTDHPAKRAFTTFFILGIPVIIYAALYHCSTTPLGSTAAIRQARLWAESEAKKIKIEAVSPKEIEKIREKIRKRLEPRPLLPWIIAIYALTTLAALLKTAGSKPTAGGYPRLPQGRSTLAKENGQPPDEEPQDQTICPIKEVARDHFPPLPSSSLLLPLPWLIASCLALALIALWW
ncbi:MAG: M50 family metallopeptidase [bacterium]|nr:M50 family metallopeptidase [bacterium]